ncbi:MAG: hypothetical protein NZL83_00435 [Candidatus Absconditabacterales bacterium]|nr:hypothetical protein [Candidatus Absconditabacterales bacterium]
MIRFSSLLTIPILIILAACTGSTPETASPELNAFAQCLTQKGAIFYGTEWCQFCQQQKNLFLDAIQYITFVDCDKNRLACSTAGIQSYPTRVINGTNAAGVQSLEFLASQSGCPLPSVN